MVLAAGSACGVRPATVPSADLYVAPDGDDDWAGTLPAPNRDRTNGPLRTLEHARDVLRANPTAAPATVMVRGGAYYLDATLTFDERDPPTTYRAYPGETPEWVGGRPINGWEPHTGEIWKAPVPSGWTFRTLFENGIRAVPARHPNDRYATVQKAHPDAWQTRFGFRPEDVPPGLELSGFKPPRLQVFIWPGGEAGDWNWFSDTLNVAAIDRETNTLTLAYPARYPIGHGSRYFIQNDLSLLDAPGEFFLDEAASTVYYWPRQAPIADQQIVAATTRRVIACVGRSPETPVRGLAFEGLALRVSDTLRQAGTFTGDDEGSTADDGLVVLENARDIRVTDCRITNTGLHAVLMNGAVSGCAVTGCEITDIGHTGVQINAAWTSAEGLSTGNTVSGNHIYNTGKTIGHGAGIQLVNSQRNTLTFNCIHHTPRYAISLKSPRPGIIIGQTIDGIAVTRENAKDFAHSRDNEIAYNDLSHANTDSQDTGVFESWGGGLGNRIHHNRIHHSDILFSFGFGLYLDDAADGFIVHDNLLHNLQDTRGLQGMLSSAFMVKGVGNVLTHNVAANNQALAGIRTFEMADEPNRDLVFKHNIVSNSGLTAYDFTNWSPERFAEADFNCFHLERVSIKLASIAPTLAGWQAQGYDAHALIADPGFVDAANGDYRLRPDSPARTLGITSIPVAAIGLPAGYRYTDPADPLARVFVNRLTRPDDDPDAETVVVLAPGEAETLPLLGRSATGFVVDLRDAKISYTSVDPGVATVSPSGQVQARASGSTEITLQVTHGPVSLRTVIYVIVRQGATE